MNETRLRNVLGLYLILTHFMLIFLVLLLWALGKGFDFHEMADTLMIVAPMFALYSTAIVRQMVSGQPRQVERAGEVDSARVFVSLFIPSVFIAALLVVIGAWFWRTIGFQEFKGALAAVEALFGVYVGLVVSSLFRL